MLVTEWLTFHISSGSGDTGFRSHEGTISVERQAEEQTNGGPKNSKESGQGGKIQVSSSNFPLVGDESFITY